MPIYPILPEHPPQDTLRNMVISLLLFHKTQMEWLGKLPCPLKHPRKGIEVVQCSTSQTKTTLLLLNLSFN